ncbi:MAG: hypothetical protein KDJ38_07100 [Gammaproteobacteria bacterium]|nr:hypothetical protein [Gammaproteobacteria bacterium]
MKKRLLNFAAGLSLLAVSGLSGALADSGWYGDVAAEVYDIRIDGQSYFPRQLKISAGHWLLRDIGLELHAGSSIGSDSSDGFELETAAYQGVSIRWQSPRRFIAKAYILTGYGRLQLDGSLDDTGFPGKEWFSGPVLSLGLIFPFSERSGWNAGLSYNHYFLEDDLKIEGINAVLRYEF